MHRKWFIRRWISTRVEMWFWALIGDTAESCISWRWMRNVRLHISIDSRAAIDGMKHGRSSTDEGNGGNNWIETDKPLSMNPRT